MTCCGVFESGQNGQGPAMRAESGTSSPVITHERVMGSLRSSMRVRKTKAGGGVKLEDRARDEEQISSSGRNDNHQEGLRCRPTIANYEIRDYKISKPPCPSPLRR